MGKHVYGVFMTLVGGGSQPMHGFFKLFFIRFIVRLGIENAQSELSIRIPLLCRFFIPKGGFLIVRLYAYAVLI